MAKGRALIISKLMITGVSLCPESKSPCWVGTSVPESLRSKGLLACWILMVDGAMWAGPFTSRDEAEALKGTWELSWPLEAAISA